MGSEKDEDAESSAPDGGWGWVVCFACFFSHVLTDGLFYSFGVVFVDLLDYFQESKGKTAIIASLAPAVCFLIGPIVAVLVNRFGCRAVAVSGGLLASLSHFVSVFAPSIQFLYVTLGVTTGIGYGLIYLPSIVSVSQYFKKRRAFATGLGVSGSGIGTFAFSPITSLLIKKYTWRGAILIQSGLVLNCVACGLVFLPVKVGLSRKSPPIVKSVKQTSTNKNGSKTYDNIENNSAKEALIFGTKDGAELKEESDAECNELELSLQNSRNKLESNDNTLVSRATPDNHRKRVSSPFDMRIFSSVPFCLFLVSTFFYSMGYYVPYIYLPDMAIETGIGELDAAWLLSSIGITNTVGRVLFGFLSDRKCINRLMLYNTALVICGAATTVGPLLTSFWALLIYTLVFGMFSGVTISLTSVIVADIVGIDRLADAFGVNNFFAGMASFAGPPLAGWLYDVSGDYMVSFVCSGIFIAFSGLILYLIPFLSKNKPTDQPASPS